MPAIADARDQTANDYPRRFYLRMMATWASVLISTRRGLAWPEKDPLADFRDRNWRRLYAGSILDD
ncbi:MAG: hypothetical protein V3U29_05200 [Phycisphaeraceae bacterium]